MYTKLQYRRPNTEQPFTNPPLCAQVYRTIKFLPKQDYSKEPEYDEYSGIHNVEHYIEHTKREINQQLSNISRNKKRVTNIEQKTIRKL